LGVVNEPVIEAVQRDQADLISRLDATVHVLNAAVAELRARVDSARDGQEAAGQFMTESDAAFVALRRSISELREAQNATKESWLQPVAELNAAATKARSDIVRLRASLDELSRPRRPEVAATSARIEPAMVQYKFPGAIRGSIHASGERPRSLASQESSSADGHIFDLKLAQ
jgi:chromosome segregation ATPase